MPIIQLYEHITVHIGENKFHYILICSQFFVKFSLLVTDGKDVPWGHGQRS